MNKYLLKSSAALNNAYAFAWALFILVACGAPPRTFEELKLEDILGYDKPIHAILFGVQAILLVRVLNKHNTSIRQAIVRACYLSAGYGVLIEVLQKFYFEGRSYDYYDMMANALGCLLVWIFYTRKAALKNQDS
jgi:VanZ family protein